jgi:thymidylate synthase (FAD)
MLRHRSFSFQEFSQRYANPERELQFVLRDARMQHPTNRQASVQLTEDEAHIDTWFKKRQEEILDTTKKVYTQAIQLGIAKEQARALLPEGLTESRLYMNGSLRSWIHYIELRAGCETQLEHQEVAISCCKALATIFPLLEKVASDGLRTKYRTIPS